MARKSLSELGVRALKPRAARFAYPDPELRGHFIRVQPSGAKSYCAVARNPAGKQIWTTIGSTEVLPIAEARIRAREILQRVRDGLTAVKAAPNTFREIAEQWIKRHAEAKGLRTIPQIKRLLNVHVLSVWGERPFPSIRRSDIAALLDDIEDHHGARQADMVLTVVRSIMNWYATRNDDYTPPVSKGMGRQNQKEHARARMLTDDEIRSIWKAAENNGTFGGIVRLALLTAQRRTKVASMKWSDISLDGEWTISKEPREKDNAGSLALPAMVLDIIRAQPRLASNEHIFAGRGGGPFCGFSTAKAAFDAKIPEVEPWVIHDLRRTARSLMSRAGVQSEIAEKVMGHSVGGVEGIYDRFEYMAEKADALRRLAALIDGIVHERSAAVVPMRRGKRRQHGTPAQRD
jgi:integrase